MRSKTLPFTVIKYTRELIVQKWQRYPFYYGIHSTYGFYWNKSWWCPLRRQNTYSVRT